MNDCLDSESAGRVFRRAQEIEEARGAMTDAALEPRGVSAEALISAADEIGIHPDAVRDAIVLERIERAEPVPRRSDRVVGPEVVIARRVVARSVDDALDAVEEWMTTAHQMRCIRTASGAIECRPRGGLGASLSRAASSFTGDVKIHPIDRIVVESHPQRIGATPDSPRTLVNLAASRRSTRAWHLGGGAAGGAGAVGAAVVGIAESMNAWPLASVPLAVGGALVARAGGSHAARVELELTRLLASIDRSERPTGLVGRAAQRARDAVRSVRPRAK